MPDISMCANTKCKARLPCYRYTAKPSAHWQAYSSFGNKENTQCDNFIDNGNTRKANEK